MRTWIVFVFSLCMASHELHAQPFQNGKSAAGVREPVTFDGLTVWLIEGTDRLEHPYLTLEEALTSGSAILYNENSQTLRIVNRSDTDLFLEAGDLLKGGQQDRMIADDRILPAHDSSDDLTVFCIEQGRSTARGTEPLATFSGSHWIAPLAHTRLVARASLTEQLLAPNIGGLTAPDSSKLALLESLSDISSPFGYPDPSQESVWNDVTQVQRGLTHALQDSVTKNASPTSMELALEHTSVAERERSFERHLGDAVKDDARAIGFVYAIDDTIVGAEQYATHALFTAMWPKFLRSIAVAAIVRESAANVPLPSAEAVENFLSAQGLATAQQKVNPRTTVEAARTNYATRFVTTDEKFPIAPLHVEWIAK